jgi:hypothetical protein
MNSNSEYTFGRKKRKCIIRTMPKWKEGRITDRPPFGYRYASTCFYSSFTEPLRYK